mmetsp:Transcript_24832/g.45566  ORF Transcript_24832/g.45566 Transcript_24832/m.45566 type:complete len:200 (-) Transcript_24832:29-628(-)
MQEAEPSSRERCLAAVKQDWLALQSAAKSHKGDKEIVLEAVRQDGAALQFAADSCKRDREVVLAAVKQHWRALEHAAAMWRSDRDVVLTAVEQDDLALKWASDELLEDVNFAADIKRTSFMLRISLMSGRYTLSPAWSGSRPKDIIRRCCERLDMAYTGSEALLHGFDVVPKLAYVPYWPGMQPRGHVSEYQLVLSGPN